MQNPVILTGQEAATNADVLNGTRLAAAPYPGILTLKMQASDNVAANHFLCTIALPGGDVPFDAQRVMGGATAGLAGIIDDRMALIMSFYVQLGGNVLWSLTEVGDTEVTWLARFAPRP